MTKNQKQFVSLLIVLVLIFAGISAIGMANVSLTEDQVFDKLSEIQQTDYSDGSHFEDEGFAGASTCYGFAKKIQYLIFGNMVSWSYDGTERDGLILIDRVDYPYSSEKMKALLSQAKVGDLIQMDRGTVKYQHSMIFAGLTSDKFIVYDANWQPDNEVDIRWESFNAYDDRDHAHISLLRNVNYSDAPTDNENPVISGVEVTDQTDTSFTVIATVSDNIGVTSVKMPTWTSEKGQDDIRWYDASVSENTATYTVMIKDHNNEKGVYNTHVYVYDKAGNYSVSSVTVNMNQIESEKEENIPVEGTEASSESHVEEDNLTNHVGSEDSNLSEVKKETGIGNIDSDLPAETDVFPSDGVSLPEESISSKDENHGEQKKDENQEKQVVEENQELATVMTGRDYEGIENSAGRNTNDGTQKESVSKTKANVNTGFEPISFSVAAFVALALIIAIRLIALMVQKKND